MTLNVLIGNGSWYPVAGAPSISTTSLANASVNSSYSQTLSATGATPITWSIVGGGISPLTLDSSTGSISGIPATATTLSATFRATNISGTNDKTLSIIVNEVSGPTLSSAPVIYTWRAA